MSDTYPPPVPPEPPNEPPNGPSSEPPTQAYPPTPAYPPAPPYVPVAAEPGPVGQVRGTGFAVLIFIITFGIYGWWWWFKTHEEMKTHTGQGVGGPVALLLAIFVTVAMPYVTSSEVGGLYTRRGEAAPVSAATGLWYFPGMIIIVGPIIWFVKTNGALNDYWRSLGATG